MIRILAIFKTPVPYFAPLFKLLAQRDGVELTVVYCLRISDEEKFYDFYSKKYIRHGVNVLDGYKYIFLDDRMKKSDGNDLKIIKKKIIRVIKGGDYDVILNGMSYWSLTTWMGISTAKKNHIPIVTRATVEAEKKRNKLLLFIKKVVVKKYCSLMSAGVYECKSQKDYLLHYGMKPDALFFCPCAVDNDYFIKKKNSFSRDKIRSELGIKADTVVIIVVSMLIPRKRPMDVLQAFKILKDKGYNATIYFLGNGDQRIKMEKLISQHHISGVNFTGRIPQDEVSKYLTAADIYIMASEADASPKALNEAMNFSLPIVVSDGVETIEQLLIEGQNGYKFRVGDVNGIASAVEKIMRNPNRDKMGEKSQEIVGQYSFNRVVDNWILAMRYAVENNEWRKK